jgi:ribosomal protein L40E
MAETVTCQKCGAEGEYLRTCCRKCGEYIPAVLGPKAEQSDSALDYLKEISGSLKTIKHIAIWWLILSILGVVAYILSRLW